MQRVPGVLAAADSRLFMAMHDLMNAAAPSSKLWFVQPSGKVRLRIKEWICLTQALLELAWRTAQLPALRPLLEQPQW